MRYEPFISPCFISNIVEFLFSNRESLKHKIQSRISHTCFTNFETFSHLCKFFIRILFLMATSILYAQGSSRSIPTETNRETSNKKSEITVQGKKDRRDYEIFKTPSSISRLNEQDILDTGISRANDIDKQVPNFAIIDSGARNFTYYNIRGMRSTLFSDPSVGMIVDGVPLADNVALNTELFALESIEVYRGSQATVFGKNFQGGVIEINTKNRITCLKEELRSIWGTIKRRNILFLQYTPDQKQTLHRCFWKIDPKERVLKQYNGVQLS
ncbi:TonB-dependent receptor plug domain protein [Leptospira weilii str. Ecochallenge]|uniref:TonB-dependent receptor plug domain protein n=1 Tax=Leptospira weilii str. Ecochallenge TaxID=1049986 RepID=N1U242_9LEPT|nr:TonB-dependent receptor plug domain protein [Leptospira weilii str. Ecochallenge]